MRLSSVLLPEPLGPTMAMVLPTLSLRLRLSRTGAWPPSYWNVTRSKVMSLVMRGKSGAPGRSAPRVGSSRISLMWGTAGGRVDRHRDEIHHMGDVVGHLPERALERHEGADGDLALGGEIGADREHDEVQQQHRDRDRA